MEWILIAVGAAVWVGVKGFISWLKLLMEMELQRREIKRLNKVIQMYEARNGRLESLYLDAESRAEAVTESWPDVVG